MINDLRLQQQRPRPCDWNRHDQPQDHLRRKIKRSSSSPYKPRKNSSKTEQWHCIILKPSSNSDPNTDINWRQTNLGASCFLVGNGNLRDIAWNNDVTGRKTRSANTENHIIIRQSLQTRTSVSNSEICILPTITKQQFPKTTGWNYNLARFRKSSRSTRIQLSKTQASTT